MKRLLATGALAVSTVLAALGGASTAGAGGRPPYGCPPRFIGPVTVQQYLGLPRIQAGLAAGAYDVAGRTAGFEAIDLNDDGTICADDVAALVGSGADPIWQYFYNIVDDSAASTTA